MAITKYQSGSNFERRVLKHLIGNNTSTCTGCLNTLVPTLLPAARAHPPTTPPMIYGIRAAGSRGDFDLIIIITVGDYQCVLGVQCKTSSVGENTMKGDLRRIKKTYGIVGVYAYRDKRKIIFYPELSEVLIKL